MEVAPSIRGVIERKLIRHDLAERILANIVAPKLIDALDPFNVQGDSVSIQHLDLAKLNDFFVGQYPRMLSEARAAQDEGKLKKKKAWKEQMAGVILVLLTHPQAPGSLRFKRGGFYFQQAGGSAAGSFEGKGGAA